MRKVFLSILLALSMLLANINVIAKDNSDAEFKEAVELLSMLNIISVYDTNDDFSTQAYVTREEFCVYLSRAFKFEASAGEKQVFSDIPQDSELSQYINAMYNRGIVEGDGGYFRPRDIITYNEAIKMLVIALNYNYASQLGGYPTGYLKIALSLGITKNVPAFDRLTKGAAAQLIYNSMTAPYMEIVRFEGSNPVFKSYRDESVLTELYDIYEGKGVVLANGLSSFVSGITPNGIEEVLIEDTIYKVGKSNASNLLGHYIEFYYLKNDYDEYEIVMITKDDAEELVINSNQNITFDNNTYRYDDAYGKKKRAGIASDFRLIYNFAYPSSGFTSANMVPAIGRVRLIRSKQSGDYDAVIIEDYTCHLVAGVDADNEIIYYKDGTKTDLNTRDFKIFNAEGKEIGISSIKEWNVVSAMMSTDGTKGTLYVSDKEIEGKVSAVGKADDPKVMIDAVQYNVNPDVLSSFEIGKNIKAYFDYNGNIAGIGKADTDGMKYAYLVRAWKDDDYNKTGEERVLVKVFDENGEQNKYCLAKKAKINDKSDSVDDAASTLLGLTENIIKIKTNISGEIDRMYVYDPINDTEKKYIQLLQDDSAPHYWNLKQRCFDGKVTVKSDARVFAIPSDSDVEDYRILGIDVFENDHQDTAKIYTTGDNAYGEVLIKNSAETSVGRPVAIVKKVELALNEDNETCAKMKVFYNGAEQEYFLDEEIDYIGRDTDSKFLSKDLIGVIGKGDVIKIGFNHKGIKTIRHIYNYESDRFITDTNLDEPDSSAKYRSKNRCVYGYAYTNSDGLLRYTKNLPTDASEPTDLENALLSAFRIYIVDQRGVYYGNELDIIDYKSAGASCSKVIVHTMWGDSEDIIIIK